MSALVEGTWMTLGFFAGLAAAVSLTAALTFLWLTWWQDREERQRPERRRWVTIEETNAKERRAGSVVGLAFTIVAILVVVVLAALGV
jgi:nicotinamide riboside transporter PnuC